MTREEAKEQATVTRYRTVYDVNSSLNHPQFSLIDEIYDDFQSRTCENCKHGKNYEHKYSKCSIWKHIRIKTHGCNEFERKDK